MAKQRAIFVKGCKEKNQIPEKKANEIFDLLEKFAGYGFNKSHAAAYAIVAYQTAYLKANYPVEFFCAMMTNDMSDTAKLSQYINEAREFGIEVLQPDVNESQVHFAPAERSAAVPAAAPANAKAGIRKFKTDKAAGTAAAEDSRAPRLGIRFGWPPSRVWAKSRWKRFSRRETNAENSLRFRICASAWMAAR